MKNIAFILTLTLALASTSFGGLDGSKHDMRVPGSPEPPCLFCHLPHKEAEEPPLWDKETGHRSWPLKALKKEKASASKVCLSCHDGNIAQDITAFIPAEEFRRTRYLRREGFHVMHLDFDITEEGRDHPVGIRYKTLARHNQDLRPEPIGELKLKKGRIDCTTCHSVHGDTPFDAFLVMDNRGSTLCSGCHVK